MPNIPVKSAIDEVRDQLSLDFADGAYLNAITANLGISRPKLGFSDDVWRAVVKVLALQYKQIETKFADVFSILFGPYTTQTATLATAASVGDTTITVHNSFNLPQIGTLILDAGTISEESIKYNYIDRYNHIIYLETPIQHLHNIESDVVEYPILLNSSIGDTKVYTQRNASKISLSQVVGRGTGAEESAQFTSIAASGAVTFNSALTKAHTGVTPTNIQSTLFRTYVGSSEVLSVVNTKQFQETGVALVGPSSNTFAVTSGSTTSINFASNTFTPNRQVSNILVFTGNITPALAGVERDIISNTDGNIILRTALPTAPAAGDTVRLKHRIVYTRNSYDDNALILAEDIKDASYPAGTVVEDHVINETILSGQIKVLAGGWDIYQVTPTELDIYFPSNIQDVNDLRSASYLHQKGTGTSTTLSVAALTNDTYITTNSVKDWPITGTVTIGGSNTYGYTKKIETDKYNSAGSTSLTIHLVTGGLPVNGLAGQTIILGNFGTAIAQSNTANTITFTTPLKNHIFNKLVNSLTDISFVSPTKLLIHNGIKVGALIGASVTFYQPVYTSTALVNGNTWTVPNTYPGPYVYDSAEQVPNLAQSPAPTLSRPLASSTRLNFSATGGLTAIEVDDATSCDLVNFPYNAVIGGSTGNVETVSVTDINLKQRVKTTVAANSSIGDQVIQVVALSGGGASSAADFPNSLGYRIIIDKGGINEEIIAVSQTLTGPNRIAVRTPFTKNHVIGETVELMNDVLSVTALTQNHTGLVNAIQATLRWPQISSTDYANAATVDFLTNTIPLTSTVGFPTAGTVILNFADQSLAAKSKLTSTHAAGAVTLLLTSTAAFPTTYPYEVYIGRNTPHEERVLVTNNNTGLNRLTINSGTFGVDSSWPAGTTVEYIPGQTEVIEYTNISGNNLVLPQPLVLEYTHQTSEIARYSTITSEPRTTGVDFPLRLPTEIIFRVQFLLDLIRAAGINVNIIDKR